MKAYHQYMDNISVSSTLHQDIMSCADHGRTKRRSNMMKRYTAAFACLAVILFGVVALPQFIQDNVKSKPGDSPSVIPVIPVIQSGSTSDIPSVSNKYTLDFNRAAGQVEAKIYIPGHYWQEVTANDMKSLFPALENTYTIKATANFQSDDNGAALFNIDANVKSVTGREIYIQMAPGEIALDYVFDTEIKKSDVLGTAVTAGYFETKLNHQGLEYVIYFAAFELSDVAYYVELGGAGAEREALEYEISELVGMLIEGGAADMDGFHPVVPERREDRWSLEEARADADFGAYLPLTLPDGFVFEDAMRIIDQERNTLLVIWTGGTGYIDWRVSVLDDRDKNRITSATDTKNYDLAMYPIPRAHSVPGELREMVNNPIFLMDELTLDVVQARTYEAADSGDELGQRMRFGVLDGDILVELNAKGVAAQEIFEMLHQFKGRNR